MVAIKLETKVGRGKASPITATINFWTCTDRRCFLKHGQEFPEILGYQEYINKLEAEIWNWRWILRIICRFQFSWPILQSQGSFLLLFLLPLKMSPLYIYHTSSFLFFFYSWIIFLDSEKFSFPVHKQTTNIISKNSSKDDKNICKKYIFIIRASISLLHNHPWILTKQEYMI